MGCEVDVGFFSDDVCELWGGLASLLVRAMFDASAFPQRFDYLIFATFFYLNTRRSGS